VFVKDKCGKYQSKLKTYLQGEMLSKKDNSWVPKLTGIEVKIKLYNCRKRDRQEVPVLHIQFIRKNCLIRETI
jgi:hypothetical protein